MKILIATDGSDFSEAAVEQVCRMFPKAQNTFIKVVSTYEPPLMAAAAPYATPATYNPALEKQMKESAVQAVSRSDLKIRDRLPDMNNVLTTEVLCGPPAQEIIQQADDWGADLVVVGSHGYGFWERVFLGSVSDKIVHHAPCSVLIVRTAGANKPRQFRDSKTIGEQASMKVLVATEGSEFSKAAIKKCCKMFGESDNTEIRIVSAVEPTIPPTEPFAVPAEYIQELDAAERGQATDVVSQAQEEIRKCFPSFELTTEVLTGSPAQAIVKEAEEWRADVIIVGSHGYGFWQRALLGSVSSSIVHHAPCSVFVVRRPEKLNGKDN